jgi:hypothetical protein
MKKFFVDTTVLAELLLKRGPSVDHTRKVLSAASSALPVFAIRELKSGPLQYWVWFHNKLAVGNSLATAVTAIHKVSRTPQRYRTSTALEALALAQQRSIGGKTLGTLVEKYGSTANADTVHADEIRLHIKRLVFRAWAKRRDITTNVVVPLSCYQEVSPTEDKKGLLDLAPNKCFHAGQCCLAKALKDAPAVLEKLKNANDGMPQTPEARRRGRVLKDLIRKPKQALEYDGCRALGDALFAFFAPADAAILTTNVKDHSVLALAIGKQAVSPSDFP